MESQKYKLHVGGLTKTCIYDYKIVYRICSVFGIKQAKEIINSCSQEMIRYLLDQYFYFPDPMDTDGEEIARMDLGKIDPELPRLFESLLQSSEYNSETLYQVFMSHGSGAKEIVEYATHFELMPFQLLTYSDKKLNESAEESFKKIKVYEKSRKGEEKLPRKLRNGW
jgi:hypothetical protein